MYNFFRNVTEVKNLELSFHKTIEDAELQINPLSTPSYINLKSQQIIFVGINNKKTKISDIIRIVLLTTYCKKSNVIKL